MKDDNKVKEFEDKVLRGMHLEDAIQTIRDYMEANPDLTGAEILQSFQYNSNDEHNSVEWFLSQLVSGQISMEDMRKLSFPDDIISYIQALLDGLKEGILPSPDSDPLPTNPHTENRGRHVRPKGLKYSKRKKKARPTKTSDDEPHSQTSDGKDYPPPPAGGTSVGV